MPSFASFDDAAARSGVASSTFINPTYLTTHDNPRFLSVDQVNIHQSISCKPHDANRICNHLSTKQLLKALPTEIAIPISPLALRTDPALTTTNS